MSLLEDLERKENPIKKYISWSKPTKDSDNKEWCYWDKELKQNVIIKRPIYFMPVDNAFAQCTGFNEEKRAGYFSTQVSVFDLKKKPITLYLGGEKLRTGFWHELKEENGVKFAQVINAVMITPKKDSDPDFELVAFVFTGGSFSGGKKSELEERRKLFNVPQNQISGWSNLGFSRPDRRIITICEEVLSFVNAIATQALKSQKIDKEITYDVPLFEMSKSAKPKDFVMKFKNLLDKYQEYKDYKAKESEQEDVPENFANEVANSEIDLSNTPLPDESQPPSDNIEDDLPF